ncbi:DNA-binding pseudobarrel domain-containing protein [Artemisia annua]|uniref:DNA-binding pseudobarrel domain-containing protein n=1 Tax=Artemisia annua TaxID=35608 RepID=A0A2U1QN65_ARTAN|nr:DNA-binding pseudobarrel domain-containing protein [Artemisia annua]
MKGHEGYKWTMRILAERNFRTEHSLSSGCSKLRRHCNLSDGDTCFFKYNKKERINSKKSTTNAVGAVKIVDECSPTDKPRDGVNISVECELGRKLDMAQKTSIDVVIEDELQLDSAEALYSMLVDVLNLQISTLSTTGVRERMTSALQVILGKKVCLGIAQVVRRERNHEHPRTSTLQVILGKKKYKMDGHDTIVLAGAK